MTFDQIVLIFQLAALAVVLRLAVVVENVWEKRVTGDMIQLMLLSIFLFFLVELNHIS